MVVTCVIDINEAEDGVHRPGQSVSGFVILSLDKPTEIEYIVTSLEGISKSIFFARYRPYLIEEPIVSQAEYMAQHILEPTAPGNYKYPFDFTLPHEAPSSFNETMGCIDRVKISYNIQVKVKINNVKKCVQCEKEVFVRGNVVPRTLTNGSSQTYLMKKNLISLCHQPEREIIIMTTISQRYVKPGGVLNMLFQIVNHTDIKIAGIRSEFFRTISMLNGSSVIKTYRKTFKENTVQLQSVDPNCETSMFTLLGIPEGINTIKSMVLLSVDYKVKVTMLLPFPHRNTSIVITVPVGVPKADDAANRTEAAK